MNTCPFCGAINSIANIAPPPGTNAFMLMAINSNGNFNIPPDGLLVTVKGCNHCGSMMFGSSELVGQEIRHD